MKPIRIAIVEDDGKLRRTLGTFLGRASDMHFAGGYGSAEEALAGLPADPPDIVLMDIRLPGLSGIECVKRLGTVVPGARVIMLTAYEDSDEIFQSLAAGAYGYLLKSTEPARLLESIREVHEGGSPISGSVARKMLDFFRRDKAKAGDAELATLSAREVEVLELLAAGQPYKGIADAVGASLNTVRTHIKRIYEKLHVHSRTEAILKFKGTDRRT